MDGQQTENKIMAYQLEMAIMPTNHMEEVYIDRKDGFALDIIIY